MAAETQLQGTIRLTADTKDAAREAKKFTDKVGAGESSGKSFASGFVKNLNAIVGQRLAGMAGMFGPVGQAFSRTLSEHQKTIAAVRGKAAPALGGTVTAAETGGASTTPTASAGATAAVGILKGAAADLARLIKSIQSRFNQATSARTAGEPSSPGRKLIENARDRVRGFLPGSQAPAVGGPPRPPGGGQVPPGGSGASGGGAGGGAGPAAGEGSAGGEAAAGGMMAGRGLLMSAGVVAGIGLAIGAFLKGLKSVTERFLDFARGLGSISGRMAAVFALFDVQMMLLKKRIGDELAPVVKELTNAILRLIRDNMPLIVAALKTLGELLTYLVEEIRLAIGIFTDLVAVIAYLKNLLPKVVQSNLPSKGMIVAPGATLLMDAYKRFHKWLEDRHTPPADSGTLEKNLERDPEYKRRMREDPEFAQKEHEANRNKTDRGYSLLGELLGAALGLKKSMDENTRKLDLDKSLETLSTTDNIANYIRDSYKRTADKAKALREAGRAPPVVHPHAAPPEPKVQYFNLGI